MMPPKGAAAPSEASATLSGLVHERFVSDEIGRLLDEVAPLEEQLGHDSDDASLIRVTRRDWEKARRVPAELAAAWAREGGKAHVAWLEAREASEFSIFLPALQRVHDVALRWAELMEQGDSPYDAFLDEYEPGMTTAEVKAVFDVLGRNWPQSSATPASRQTTRSSRATSRSSSSRSSSPRSCATLASRRARTSSTPPSTRSPRRSPTRTSG